MTPRDQTDADREEAARLNKRQMLAYIAGKLPDLSPFSHITLEAACLVAWLPRATTFWLTELDARRARAFTRRKVAITFAALTSLEGIPDEVLRALGRNRNPLGFDAIQELSDDHILALVSPQSRLSLGVTSLTVGGAKALARSRKFIELSALPSLTVAQAEVLASSSCELTLSRLADLDEATAAAFANGSNRALTLGALDGGGTLRLSARSAARLSRFRGASLACGVEGLLSVEAAQALAGFAGTLTLPGSAISDEAAAALSRHRGALSFEGALPHLGAEGARALSAHHGAIAISSATSPAPAALARWLVSRTLQPEPLPATPLESALYLTDGFFEHLSVPRTKGSPVAIPLEFLALAQHVQDGTTTATTLREVLSWFFASRRGKGVQERIESAIDALAGIGIRAAAQIRRVLEAEGLDDPIVFPEMRVGDTSATLKDLALVLRTPLAKRGYALLPSAADTLTLVERWNPFGPQRSFALEVRTDEARPAVLRVRTVLPISADPAVLTRAVQAVNRLNRTAPVGRAAIRFASPSVSFDVWGALSDLTPTRKAKGPAGLLPHLLGRIALADALLQRWVLDAPTYVWAETSIEKLSVTASERYVIRPIGEASTSVASTSPTPPALIGVVLGLNARDDGVRVAIARDDPGVDVVIVTAGGIVTDGALKRDIKLECATQLRAAAEALRAACEEHRWSCTKVTSNTAQSDTRSLKERCTDAFGSSHNFDDLVGGASSRYRVFRIPKRSGGHRVIHHPSPFLKKVQRFLLDEVMQDWPSHPSAHAYRAGRNIASNAQAHVDSRYLMRMDLRAFFPSLTAADVQAFLTDEGSVARGWSAQDRNDFIALVTRYGRLTIGAPTSPALSNALCYELDVRLTALADSQGVTYTRYADDLFFSTNARDVLRRIEAQVPLILWALPYPRSLAVNTTKTIHVSRKNRRVVTGLVLTHGGEVSIGRQRKREIRALIHKRATLSDAERQRLHGLLSFASSIEHDFIAQLTAKYGADAVRDVRPQ